MKDQSGYKGRPVYQHGWRPLFSLLGALILGLAPWLLSMGERIALGARDEGSHPPANHQVSVGISFDNTLGYSVTDETGIHYFVDGWEPIYEEKVYPEEYWGTFPLYLAWSTADITVMIHNEGAAAMKLRVVTEAYEMKTDGTNGVPLTDPREFEIKLKKFEQADIDSSFYLDVVPGMEGGLDRLVVKVYRKHDLNHEHDGDGGDSDWELICEEEGIFCPPPPWLVYELDSDL